MVEITVVCACGEYLTIEWQETGMSGDITVTVAPHKCELEPED